MKLERSKNATRNVVWGAANKIIVILAQLVIRATLVRVLGEQYLGLNSWFTSILSVLSLAELGITSALVFHMYRAIVEDDKEKICALLYFYRRCYHTIAVVILVLGLAVLPLLPFLVSTDVPTDVNIYILYLINLSSTVISYSLFAYKGCLLEAHQRSDLVSKIAVLVNTMQYGVQLVMLFAFKNYYLYSIVTPVMFLASNLLTAFVAGKHYPDYRPFGKPDAELRKAIFGKVKALFVYKVGNVCATSVDNLVVGAFLGVSVLGAFTNYQYIITMLFSFLLMYYNAIQAGLGNSIVTESVERNFVNFKKLLFMQSWICGFCAVCLLCLYQDFIGLWMGENMLLSMDLVLCFVVYFYAFKIQDAVTVFKDAAGMWEPDRWRPLVSAGCNLAINIVLVQFIGLYGILFSTIICCLLIDLPWAAYVLFKNYFKKSVGIYYVRLLVYTLVNVAVAAAVFGICYLIPAGNSLGERVLWFLCKIGICAVLSNLLFVLVYHRTKEFKSVWQTGKNALRALFGRGGRGTQTAAVPSGGTSVAQEPAAQESAAQESAAQETAAGENGVCGDVAEGSTENPAGATEDRLQRENAPQGGESESK